MVSITLPTASRRVVMSESPNIRLTPAHTVTVSCHKRHCKTTGRKITHSARTANAVTPDFKVFTQLVTVPKASPRAPPTIGTKLLEKVLEDAGESAEAKKEAVAKSAEIAQNILKENNIESLIRAKGFGDCVVFIQNGECSVVIKGGKSVENGSVIIKDIVMGQADIEYDKIKIIENT